MKKSAAIPTENAMTVEELKSYLKGTKFELKGKVNKAELYASYVS